MNEGPIAWEKLGFDRDSDAVLGLTVANKDFFETFENATPDLGFIKTMFLSVPKGVPIEKKLILGCRRQNDLLAVAEIIIDRHRQGEWLLSLLLLDHKFRKTVKGGKILRRLFEYIKASGANSVVGGVIEENKMAQSFWLSIGAVKTDTVYIQNLNGKPTPTRVMFKIL